MTKSKDAKLKVPAINIAENNFSAYIHLDLEGIPEVCDEEQLEIESSLNALSTEDKEIALKRRIKL